jgi:ribonuclease P protein component
MRLLTRQQYRRMSHPSIIRYVGKWILIDICLTENFFSRLGIIVTRRYGSSPQRNRFKRITREAFRLSYPFFNQTMDVLVRPRSQALTASMQEIRDELMHFVKKTFG